MTEAHAIDIEKCTECPYVGEHTRDTPKTSCSHPEVNMFQPLEVWVNAPPPKSCSMRVRPTLLRVTS